MNWSDTVIAAIQKAVDAAAEKDIAVDVEIVEHGFFPTERTVIRVTAKPKVEEKP